MRSLTVKAANCIDWTYLLSGQYRLSRWVSSPRMQMKGIAEFVPCNEGCVAYHEEATYCMASRLKKCFQHRYFRWNTSKLCILNKDQSILHAFSLTPNLIMPVTLTHTHVCKEDHYSVSFTVHDSNRFHMDYTVKGPKKSYHMESLFERV